MKSLMILAACAILCFAAPLRAQIEGDPPGSLTPGTGRPPAQTIHPTIPRPAVAFSIERQMQVPRHSGIAVILSIFPAPKQKTWHTVRVHLPKKIDPDHSLIWIQDLDHPVRSTNWTEYDPRNLAVTPRQFKFDAVVGDHVFYRVGWGTVTTR